MGANTKGDVVVEWLGETKISGNRYHLYAACSSDFGKTFSKPQNLTLGYDHSIYPALLVDDKGTYAFSYSYSIGKNERYIVFRKSSDGCKTWSNPLEIKKIGVVTLFVEPLRVGNRLHVFWLAAPKVFLSLRARIRMMTDQRGRQRFWKVQGDLIPDFCRVAHDSKGRIYISLHGKKGSDHESIYIVRSEDNGALE